MEGFEYETSSQPVLADELDWFNFDKDKPVAAMAFSQFAQQPLPFFHENGEDYRSPGTASGSSLMLDSRDDSDVSAAPVWHQPAGLWLSHTAIVHSFDVACHDPDVFNFLLFDRDAFYF